MSDTSDSDSIEEVKTNKQLIFMYKLKENKILFNKSQVPRIKKEKEEALKNLAEHYEKIFNVSTTTKQLVKKLSNMKVEVKKKFDINRTGNRKIVMKPLEKLLLEMLEVENNPIFTRIPGKICACFFILLFMTLKYTIRGAVVWWGKLCPR
jgi:hypothetical protein